MITAESERQFYDGQYAQFLTLPDHALRIDRKILEGNIDNPAHPFYERRWLYRTSMRALEAEPLRAKRVLDYGCGPADFGVWMATEGAEVTLLDFSARPSNWALSGRGLPVSKSEESPRMPAA